MNMLLKVGGDYAVEVDVVYNTVQDSIYDSYTQSILQYTVSECKTQQCRSENRDRTHIFGSLYN
jgi:hypothetical protein